MLGLKTEVYEKLLTQHETKNNKNKDSILNYGAGFILLIHREKKTTLVLN